MKGFIQETGHFSHPSVSGNVFKPADRCRSSLSSFAWAGGQGTVSNSHAVCRVGRERTEKKLFGQGSQFDVWKNLGPQG